MNKKTAKTHRKKIQKRRVYTKKHYDSNDGMLTTVWGPSTWHLMHTMSFNYPVNPSCDDKRYYRDFILNLQYVLPCGKCRKNLRKNFAKLPLKWKNMETRHTFSKYIYDLHELVNTMLHKKSGLTYNEVRERYEHFRSRCAISSIDKSKHEVDKSKPENGCTEPIVGEKSKCILQIVPQNTKCETFQIDKKCIKHRK